MEMLRFLTQKFKAQSLAEVHPCASGLKAEIKEMEECDSGTESDEENLEALQQGIQECGQENYPVFILGRSSTSPQTQALRSLSSPTPSQNTRRAGALVERSAVPFQPLSFTNALNINTSKQNFPRQDSLESCGFDTEPGSSIEFERHSSEEELSGINVESQAEKRKLDLMESGSQCGMTDSSSGSSDEEVQVLLSQQQRPLNFSASPPKSVQPARSTCFSPQIVLTNLTPVVHVCSGAPRKRARQVAPSENSNQRPCLDFEKMQVSKRHSPHGVGRARIVKIKTISGSSRPPKCLYDPAVFSFRSLSVNKACSPLTPVEEPHCAF